MSDPTDITKPNFVVSLWQDTARIFDEMKAARCCPASPEPPADRWHCGKELREWHTPFSVGDLAANASWLPRWPGDEWPITDTRAPHITRTLRCEDGHEFPWAPEKRR